MVDGLLVEAKNKVGRVDSERGEIHMIRDDKSDMVPEDSRMMPATHLSQVDQEVPSRREPEREEEGWVGVEGSRWRDSSRLSGLPWL